MSASCPFDPLIVARRVRRDSAMNEVVRCRAVVEQHVVNCAAVEVRLDANESERQRARQRLGVLANEGASPIELNRLDERSTLLAARRGEIQAELMAAERGLEAARSELTDAVHVFFLAESKLDALQQQKKAWTREQMRRRDLIEEAAVEDLIVHRIVNAR